ncbi:hypothetical protein GWI33_014523 [Rhynchophorus ferrugineus]|uniref:Uncharacterized protein n=1 Tax=Rhynchophorus ferrugineus TaxID=354439 RepID=A0A834M5E6_RHYFE|nr:hypothetical protein GWI33_014523 [Rhynchophorus ferrugineus]
MLTKSSRRTASSAPYRRSKILKQNRRPTGTRNQTQTTKHSDANNGGDRKKNSVPGKETVDTFGMGQKDQKNENQSPEDGSSTDRRRNAVGQRGTGAERVPGRRRARTAWLGRRPVQSAAPVGRYPRGADTVGAACRADCTRLRLTLPFFGLYDRTISLQTPVAGRVYGAEGTRRGRRRVAGFPSAATGVGNTSTVGGIGGHCGRDQEKKKRRKKDRIP